MHRRLRSRRDEPPWPAAYQRLSDAVLSQALRDQRSRHAPTRVDAHAYLSGADALLPVTDLADFLGVPPAELRRASEMLWQREETPYDC